jgi:hypothetical protein
MSNRNSSSHTGDTVREQVRVRAVYVAHDEDEDDDAVDAADLGALSGFDDDDIPRMSESLLLLLLLLLLVVVVVPPRLLAPAEAVEEGWW